VLDLFRSLCVGKANPDETLCNLFDQETQDGSDMSVYSNLLEKAIESFTNTFKKRAISALQTGRGGLLPEQSKQINQATDFELISWLVIKNGNPN